MGRPSKVVALCKLAEENARLKLELHKEKSLKISTQKPMNEQASVAGRLLQMQKATKIFRTDSPLHAV